MLLSEKQEASSFMTPPTHIHIRDRDGFTPSSFIRDVRNVRIELKLFSREYWMFVHFLPILSKIREKKHFSPLVLAYLFKTQRNSLFIKPL